MPIRLLTVAHSYVVALNRRLPHEMQKAGKGRYEVVAVSPRFYGGANDLRPIEFERVENEPIACEVLRTYWNSRIHFFYYERRLKELCASAGLVHCWEEPYIVAGMQICRATPRHIPFVFATFQNIAKRYPPPFSWFERHCLERSAGWIAFGKTIVENALRRGYGCRPHRLLPLGVDLDVFSPNAAARERIHAALSWQSPGPPVIGYLGRFIEEKGLDLLMRVIERLETPWRVLFVGGGPLEKQLRTWAAKFPDRARVVTGVVHGDVPAYLNAMDMLAAPSQTRKNWREQQGRMLIEAFACGLPVLGSDSGEIPFVIGTAGVVIGESDEQGWARELARLLESPALRAEYSAAGRQRAAEHYAWPRIANGYIEFFDEILASRR